MMKYKHFTDVGLCGIFCPFIERYLWSFWLEWATSRIAKKAKRSAMAETDTAIDRELDGESCGNMAQDWRW